MAQYVYENTHSFTQWILKELSTCLQRFYAPVEVLRYAIQRNFLAFAKRAFATGSHHEKPILPKLMKQQSLILENIEI